MTDREQATGPELLAGKNKWWPEKPVVMDGIELEAGDVLTLRVALNNFILWLNEDGVAEALGEMHAPYRSRASRMLAILSSDHGGHDG